MLLHIPTVLVLFVISNLLVALLMWIAFRKRREPGLGLWVASLVCLSAGWGAFLLRDVLPDPHVALLGSVGLSLGYALLLSALAAFYRVPTGNGWPYWPCAAMVLAMLLLGDSPVARQGAGSAVLGLQLALGGAFLLSRKDEWVGLRAVMGCCALVAAATALLRIWLLAAAPEQVPAMPGNSPWQTATFLVGFISRLSFIFGFILLIEARHQQELIRLATLDPLTEAFNRRTFLDLAEREMKRCMRQRQPVALLLVDLDHFKCINDSFGHLTGDAALRTVKEVATRCLRAQDLFGRYGGEEFCLLAPDTDTAGALALAERLREAIALTPPPGGAGAPALTASIGVAVWDPDVGEKTLDALVGAADEALYRAKARGRDRVEAAGEVGWRPAVVEGGRSGIAAGATPAESRPSPA